MLFHVCAKGRRERQLLARPTGATPEAIHDETLTPEEDFIVCVFYMRIWSFSLPKPKALMFSKRGGKCKIVTCTRASLPNNYGFCALHGGSSSGVNANNHRSKGAVRRQELHDICKVKVCYRRALPGNYGFCEIHRKYVSRAERVRRGFKTAVVNTNKSSHIEAETTNILRAAVSLGDMPSESVLRKLEADPIVSINRTRADILGFYNSTS